MCGCQRVRQRSVRALENARSIFWEARRTLENPFAKNSEKLSEARTISWKINALLGEVSSLSKENNALMREENSTFANNAYHNLLEANNALELSLGMVAKKVRQIEAKEIFGDLLA